MPGWRVALLRKLTIGLRLASGFGLVLGVAVLVMASFNLWNSSQLVTEAEERELRNLYHAMNAQIDERSYMAEAMSALVAETPVFQEPFAQRDRERLQQMLEPAYDRLASDYGIPKFHFHKPPATSFLRLHRPDRHGDDLTDLRPTIVETNRQQAPIRGLDGGVHGIAIRGLQPIFHDGEHVGSVGLGLSLAEAFTEQFAEVYGDDLAIHVLDQGEVETLASTVPGGRLADTRAIQQAFDGEPSITHQNSGGTPYAVYTRVIEDFVDEPIAVAEIAMDRSFYAANAAGTRTFIAVVAVVVLGLGALLAWVLTRSITVPLNEAVDSINDIAEGGGDLTKRLPETGRDEVTALAAGYNRFAEKLQELVRRVTESATQIASSVEEQSQVAEETRRGATNQKDETQQLATAMNQMSSSIQEIANNTQSVADDSREATEKARQGRQSVSETMEAINSLSQEVQSSATAINELSTQSEQIGKVLEVIRGIANQTNLLSLNAAIEAARAGESGRGFTVVAEEVRKLAQQTQESIGEIQQTVEGLQTGTQRAVEAMEGSRQQAERTVEQAATADTALDEIAQRIANIEDKANQAASAVEEQSQVAEDINRNVTRINDVSEESANSVDHIAKAIEELARLASDLRTLVERFRI